MAEEKQTTFPLLPVTHWWALRRKFKQSIPGTVTTNYLASVLNMQIRSAQTNVLPYLQDVGIIDEEGKTLDRARQWRDDTQYPEVCEEMRKTVYPSELLDAVANPLEDRAAVERWFGNHTGAGLVAVKKMAAFYVLLSEADPSKEPEERKRAKAESKKKTKKTAPAATVSTKTPPLPKPEQNTSLPASPGIYINLQVHVSSDATPDQIDKMFESMAKHIYKRG